MKFLSQRYVHKAVTICIGMSGNAGKRSATTAANKRNIPMRFRLLVLASLAFFFHRPAAAQISTDTGKSIFTARCAACHGIGKQVVGPDLKDVENLRSEQWIINFVHSSQAVIKSGDTAAVALFSEFNKTIMPDHKDLGDNDIRNIIAFIKEESDRIAKNGENSTRRIEKIPYPNSGGLLHRIIFIDLPGNHTPLKPTDYTAWMAIAVAVLFLIIALITKVKFEDSKENNNTPRE